MNIALWILQGLAAFLFVMAGSAKAFQPLDTLAKRWPWMQNVSPRFVRFLGISELAGAVGLILPAATKILPQLTIAAACGLSLLMASATIFHMSRREYPSSAFTFVLFVVVLAIALGRWTFAQI